MRLLRFPALVAALLYSLVVSSLASPSHVRTDDTKDASTLCDSYCKRRFFYQMAYSAAHLGITQAMSVRGTFSWCGNDTQSTWCPQTVKSAASAIAGDAATNVSIALTDASDEWMVSSLSRVVKQAGLNGMVWVERNAHGKGLLADGVQHHNQTLLKQLHWLMMSLKNETVPTVNRSALRVAMAPSPSNKTTHLEPQVPDVSQQGHHDHKGLAALAIPFSIAPLMFAAGCRDPVLCTAKVSEYLGRLLKGARASLPPADLLNHPSMDSESSTAEASEAAEQAGEAAEEAGEAATDAVDEALAEAEAVSEFQIFLDQARMRLQYSIDEGGSDSEPESDLEPGSDPELESDSELEPDSELESDLGLPEGRSLEPDPEQLFRTESFDETTQTLEQRTLQWLGSEIENGPHLNGLDHARMIVNGYRAFQAVSNQGRRLTNFHGTLYDKIEWSRPSDLRPIRNGEWWRSVGDQDVLFEDGEPALSSQGEPLVRTPPIEPAAAPVPEPAPVPGAAPVPEAVPVPNVGSMLTPSVLSLDSFKTGKSVKIADQYAYRLTNSLGKTIKGSDGSDAVVMYGKKAVSVTSKASSKVSSTTLDRIKDFFRKGGDSSGDDLDSDPDDLPDASPTARPSHFSPSAEQTPTTHAKASTSILKTTLTSTHATTSRSFDIGHDPWKRINQYCVCYVHEQRAHESDPYLLQFRQLHAYNIRDFRQVHGDIQKEQDNVCYRFDGVGYHAQLRRDRPEQR
ncbi:hypothetical protein LTS09_014052 [Friedmanniomyces endolithicus]|nr:hypothetical protein LTS09_014052 [Friedmanniomyces endolithicus]